MKKFSGIFYRLLYELIFKYLPKSYSFGGRISKKLRVGAVKSM